MILYYPRSNRYSKKEREREIFIVCMMTSQDFEFRFLLLFIILTYISLLNSRLLGINLLNLKILDKVLAIKIKENHISDVRRSRLQFCFLKE